MVRILVVEDELELAKNIVEIVKNRVRDIQVFEAHSISEAKTLMYKNKPNIVVLDINLPDGRGTDLYKEYKEFYPEGVVIYLTAIDSDIEKLIAFELGAEDYIIKPFNVNELTAKINNWVKRISKVSKEYIHIFSDYYFDKFSGNIFLYRDGFYHLVENLNYRESKIFEILIENVNKIVDVDFIKDRMDLSSGDLPTIVYHLRKKLSKISNIKILTIKGGKLKLVINM